MDLERYEDLKRRVQQAERSQSQAEGALKQLMTQLKEEFDCDTIEQAMELSEELAAKIVKISKKYEPAVTKLEQELNEHDS